MKNPEIFKKALPILSLLLVCVPAGAVTTVTVDEGTAVVVREVPVVVTQPVYVQPMIVTTVNTSADFEGEIETMNRSTRVIDVIDTEGRTRQVLVTQWTMDNYRVGDFVRIHPDANVREVTFIREESNRDLEGRITQVELSENMILVHDTRGRDRRIQLKQGMIGTYKTGDYVRIHLMADLKEAKMIRTIR